MLGWENCIQSITLARRRREPWRDEAPIPTFLLCRKVVLIRQSSAEIPSFWFQFILPSRVYRALLTRFRAGKGRLAGEDSPGYPFLEEF